MKEIINNVSGYLEEHILTLIVIMIIFLMSCFVWVLWELHVQMKFEREHGFRYQIIHHQTSE